MLQTRGMVTDSPIDRVLESGEKVLWSGRPNVQRLLRSNPRTLTLLVVVWLIVSLAWEVGALARGMVVMALWGLPFVAIGLFLAFGRPWLAARTARRTCYAVTDRRVLIVGSAFGSQFTALEMCTLPEMHVEEGPDGIGTITFAPAGLLAAWAAMGGGVRRPPDARSMSVAPSLQMIEHPTDVARTIEAAKAAATPPEPASR